MNDELEKNWEGIDLGLNEIILVHLPK